MAIKKLTLFILMVLLLTACQNDYSKSSKPSTDWSRGILISQASIGSVGLVVGREGGTVQLVWPENENGQNYFRFFELDAEGKPLLDIRLESSDRGLRRSRMLPAQNDQLHLFWQSHESNSQGWSLWHEIVEASAEGIEVSKLKLLQEEDVLDYVVVSDENGGALVIWSTANNGGIGYLHIDQYGDLISGPTKLSDVGSNPGIFVDEGGEIHTIWRQERSIRYAQFSSDPDEYPENREAARAAIGTNSIVMGPVIGVTEDWAYIVWSVLEVSGLEAGTAHADFVVINTATKEVSLPERLNISTEENPAEFPYQGGFRLTNLSLAGARIDSSNYLHQPSLAVRAGEDVAVALAVKQNVRFSEVSQIAIAVFGEGQFKGYVFGAKTPSFSQNPSLGIDDADNMHLTWSDSFDRDNIYYASNAPASVVALDKLQSEDFLELGMQGLVDGITGAMLSPTVGFGWLLTGFMFLGVIFGVLSFFRDRGPMSDTVSWLLLILAIGVYEIVKIASIPNAFNYVPFSAWIDIPESWSVILQISVPLLLFAFSLLVTMRIHENRLFSVWTYYFVFAAVDSVTTLTIYGVAFLGVF